MNDILMRMKSEVIRHTEIMSKILKVDVEVVDNKMNLIAGKFNHYAHKNPDGSLFIGRVYKEVIKTGKKQIISEPGVDPICFECISKDSCEEKIEICAPIIVDDEVIGVIGFVCFTDEQERYIRENLDSFIDFLDQMTGLISLKATQMKEKEQIQVFGNMMNEIIDKIDDGVIVFEKNKKLKQMNATAKKILGFHDDSAIVHDISIEKLNEQFIGNEEYKISFLDKEHIVAGQYFKFNNDDYNEVFIFKDVNDIKANAMVVLSSNEKIGVNRLLGMSKTVKVLKRNIKHVASTTSSVMIVGESGTGKELVARALHEESNRSDQPFVAINCAAIPENLLESELFGYIKGAFTGADPRGKMGKFELAHKGTLFLDEIGDMPFHIQVKLLRVLEEREIVRLGSNKAVKIDVRVVAATNKNLEELIENKIFREDLYYRLNVIPLETIPLRKREGDVKLLADFYIKRYAEIFQKNIRSISKGFMECLEHYHWPGNVRELQNTMEYVVNLSTDDGVLSEDILPEKVRVENIVLSDEDLNIECMEKKMIMRALEIYGSDGPSKRIVADKLGLGIATLYRKMKKYAIKIES